MGNQKILTIEEAIENLSNVAELSEEDQLIVSERNELIIEAGDLSDFGDRAIQWVNDDSATLTMEAVKETFSVVLSYIEALYKKTQESNNDKKALEGIKSIMILVGDAAMNLERYTHLFQAKLPEGGVTSLTEYRRLHDFYKVNIVSKDEEEQVLGEVMQPIEKILGKAKMNGSVLDRESVQGAIMNVDVVKDDSVYEFFFMKQEDGSRFFNRQLLRNIKLECDFGDDLSMDDYIEDPLIYIKSWQDKSFQIAAKNILISVSGQLRLFLKNSFKYKNVELVSLTNCAVMALMMTCNVKNLLRHSSVKSCYHYFMDFQGFLRRILCSPSYQKIMAYPPDESKEGIISTISFIHLLCQALYTHIPAQDELGGMIKQIILNCREEDIEKSHSISDHLEGSYAAITISLNRHPNGPLFKVLDLLHESYIPAFDPLQQDNIPHSLYDICLDEHKMTAIRMPSPTCQEFLNKAEIIAEFRGLLRAYAQPEQEKRHLMFNLQDRTSWKEHARCKVLEEIQLQAEFSNNINVVTMARDTSFYHQYHPYFTLEGAEGFMSQLKEHIVDEGTGYYFSEKARRAIFGDTLDEMIAFVHRFVFHNKKILYRCQRLAFIDMVHLLLEMKLIDVIRPDSFSFTCKDGVDLGAGESVLFMIFHKLIKEEITEEDIIHVNTMLFSPALLVRERCVNRECFDRLIAVLRLIQDELCSKGKTYLLKENIRDSMNKLFTEEFLKAPVKIPMTDKYF